jgi:UDP-GlcNAc:undecaprenyl-phosphate GlcNAc-1-phosphate transferase
VALALAGALLGFLGYNLPPATIFLGGSGSMLIGLVVGTLAIRSSLKAPATIALAAPMALLAIPIFDTTAAILRRRLTGRSLSSSDRGHLHHVLLRRGLSSRKTLLCISFCCFLTVLGALASLTLHNEFLAIVAALAVVGILIASRLFGYAEYLLVKHRMRALVRSFLRFNPTGRLNQVEVHLQGSAGWKALWTQLITCVGELNLISVRLDVDAPSIQESYHARWDSAHVEPDVPDHWRVDIPLLAQAQPLGQLVIIGRRDWVPVSIRIAELSKVVDEFEAAARLIVGSAHPAASGEAGPPAFTTQADQQPAL